MDKLETISAGVLVVAVSCSLDRPTAFNARVTVSTTGTAVGMLCGGRWDVRVEKSERDMLISVHGSRRFWL